MQETSGNFSRSAKDFIAHSPERELTIKTIKRNMGFEGYCNDLLIARKTIFAISSDLNILREFYQEDIDLMGIETVNALFFYHWQQDLTAAGVSPQEMRRGELCGVDPQAVTIVKLLFPNMQPWPEPNRSNDAAPRKVNVEPKFRYMAAVSKKMNALVQYSSTLPKKRRMRGYQKGEYAWKFNDVKVSVALLWLAIIFTTSLYLPLGYTSLLDYFSLPILAGTLIVGFYLAYTSGKVIDRSMYNSNAKLFKKKIVSGLMILYGAAVVVSGFTLVFTGFNLTEFLGGNVTEIFVRSFAMFILGIFGGWLIVGSFLLFKYNHSKVIRFHST